MIDSDKIVPSPGFVIGIADPYQNTTYRAMKIIRSKDMRYPEETHVLVNDTGARVESGERNGDGDYSIVVFIFSIANIIATIK